MTNEKGEGGLGNFPLPPLPPLWIFRPPPPPGQICPAKYPLGLTLTDFLSSAGMNQYNYKCICVYLSGS